MSIKKQFLKSKPVCKATFKLDASLANGAKEAVVVGDFNNWDSTASPMKGSKAGDFSVTIELESGKEYQFRYLLDGATWVNDPEADKYTPSQYGVSNCVLVAVEA